MPSFCRKCGRTLKSLESIKSGIGPVCLARERDLARTPYPKIIKDDAYDNKSGNRKL